MRRLAIFTGAFSLAVFLSQYLPSPDALLPRLLLLCLTAAAGGLVFYRRSVWGRRVVLTALGLALGLGWNRLFLLGVQAPMEALAGTETTAVMTVLDYPEETGRGIRVPVSLPELTGRVMLYGDASLAELRPGQTAEGTVRLKSASRIREDDVRTFTSQGVFLLAYPRGDLEISGGTEDSLRWLPRRTGHAMAETAAALFDGDEAAFLCAILTGDRAGLSEQTRADFSEAGLYHILAVSGMHCGFLLALLQWLIGKHRPRLLAAVSALTLGFYALLTGGRPSVVRACVMLLFLLAAPAFRRQNDGPTSLLAALFLILLRNPCAAGSVGLQLSFGAMAGILWLTPGLYRLFSGGERCGRIRRTLAAGLSGTLGALVFTAPLSACYFGVLALISPLSNLLCLWAAGGLFLTGLAAVLAGMLWTPLGAALAGTPTILARYILTAAHLLAKLPLHAVYFANPWLKYWLALAYLLFLAAALGGRRKRNREPGREGNQKGNQNQRRKRFRYALAALLTALSLVLAVRLWQLRFQSVLDAVMLDVGQGQSILLAAHGACTLVDCGSENGWYDAGSIAACHLRSMGYDRLEYLILTHYDADHINGVASLLARVDVKALLVPRPSMDSEPDPVLDLAKSYGVHVHIVDVETPVYLGGERLLVLFPPVGRRGDSNGRGLTILASAGEEDLLITGDMDAGTERKLLSRFRFPDIEYLAAGHHGSKHSTSGFLLQALRPETVCISAGAGNSYGHPAEETLRRLEQFGCEVLRTDLQGDIYLSLGGRYGTEETEEERAQ